MPFAPPAAAGQASHHQLAAGPNGLAALIDRPGVAPALVDALGTSRQAGVPLARAIGEPAALAADGRGRWYVAARDRHAIYELDASGAVRLLLAPLATAPDAARGDLEAPLALVADADGSTLWVLDGPRGERLPADRGAPRALEPGDGRHVR